MFMDVHYIGYFNPALITSVARCMEACWHASCHEPDLPFEKAALPALARVQELYAKNIHLNPNNPSSVTNILGDFHDDMLRGNVFGDDIGRHEIAFKCVDIPVGLHIRLETANLFAACGVFYNMQPELKPKDKLASIEEATQWWLHRMWNGRLADDKDIRYINDVDLCHRLSEATIDSLSEFVERKDKLELHNSEHIREACERVFEEFVRRGLILRMWKDMPVLPWYKFEYLPQYEKDEIILNVLTAMLALEEHAENTPKK